MANQIMTVLEGHVPPEKWEELVERFGPIGVDRPPELLATYLAQSTSDPTLWRTVGVWSSQQAFEAFRAEVGTPPPLALFRSLGIQPTLALFEIKG